MRFRTFGLILLLLGAIDSSPAHAQATPAVRHPRRIVLELGPGTPRPGFGPAQRPHAAPGRLASSGLPALDAVHAIHRPIVYEPMFPGADRAPAVAPGLYFARTRWGILEATERLVRLGGARP